MGFWTARAGEEDAFVAAWTEFAEWIGRVRQHTDEFRPAEAELAAQVASS